MPLPTNPYHSPTIAPKADLQPVYARVDPQDLAYLRSLFPLRTGIVDIVLSNLFHSFINELRNLELDHANDDHRCWHVEHSTAILVDKLLRRTNFDGADLPSRESSGETGA